MTNDTLRSAAELWCMHRARRMHNACIIRMHMCVRMHVCKDIRMSTYHTDVLVRVHVHVPALACAHAHARLHRRSEGLGGFYASYGSNYAYSTPVDGIKFLLYERLKGGLLAPSAVTRSAMASAQPPCSSAAARASPTTRECPADL